MVRCRANGDPTARVITTAAAIMVVVFSSFVLSDDTTVKMLAVGMAVATDPVDLEPLVGVGPSTSDPVQRDTTDDG
jgi:hypothetical protein